METSQLSTHSYWWDVAPPQRMVKPLPDKADVVIVGSGYCGLSAAIELARHGCRPLVLDAGPLGAGASTLSGGMVSSGQKLVRASGVRGKARERVDALLADLVRSFDHIERLISEEKLNAGYSRSGRYSATTSV